jgi:hypothetical protein
MRFSLATATCAGVIAALLAGCSSSQQASQSLPLGVAPQSGHAGMPTVFKGHKIGPLQLIKLQADGKLPGPEPTKALKYDLKRFESGLRPNFKGLPNRKAGGVAAFATDTDYGYLVGLSKKYKGVSAVNMSDNGCNDPVTVKVDHSGNAWVACEYNSDFNGPAAEEYSKTGALVSEYNGAIPCLYSQGCEFSEAYGFDTAETSSNVFDSLTFFEAEYCNPSCYETYGGGYEFWPAGSPSSGPTVVTLPYCAPICDVYYMDADNNGNLWIAYYGYSGEYGYGVAEVQNPASGSPTVVSVISPGTLGFPGGVYVSNGGTVLNVTDQDTRVTTQYSISGSSLSETGTIGPTGLNLESLGDPVAGGMNSTDTTMSFGDAYGWVDSCVGATCKLRASADFPDGAQGFAFDPSDK